MALTINGEKIDDEIIESEFAQIKAFYENLGRVSCCERDPEFRKMAKENVTGRVLLMQEAERRDLGVGDPEVGEAYDRLIAQHGAKEHVLIEAGLSLSEEAQFLEDLRSNLRLEKMLMAISGGGDEPDEDTLRAYYDANVGDFLTTEEVRVSHLFKSPQPVEKTREIYAGLRKLRDRALEGEDFDGLAREHSDREDEEIDLGFFKQGDYMDEFEAIAFSMKLDEVSPIFATQWGYHLIKVTGRKDPEPHPFDEVKDRVREFYINETRRKKIDGFVADLRMDAKVEDDDPDEDEEGAAAGHPHAHAEH